MKQETKKNKTNFIIISFIIIFTLFLTYLFPYTGDDWAWGSKVGFERLSDWFKNYNGRYLGNVIVILLTRSRILRTIIMTVTILGILYLCMKIVNKEKPQLYYIGFMLFLAIPRLVFRQAIVWTSGFTNYAISIALTLIYIYLNKDLMTDHKSNKSIIYCLLIFSLGITSALFIENLTIYNIVLGLAIIIYSYLKYKKVANFNISYLIGAVTGAIIMFSNGAYHNIANNIDTYRTVPNGMHDRILRMLKNYFEVIHLEMIFNNLFLNIIITSLLVLLTYKFLNKNTNKKIKNIVLISLIINISYVLYTLLIAINSTWSILLKYTMYFEGIITSLYFLSIVTITFITVLDKNRKTKLMFYLLSIIMMIAPLLFVTPIGSRCFFSTYVMFIVYILELIDYLISDEVLQYMGKISIISSVVFGVYLLSIYSYIFMIDNKRINYIRKMSKTQEVLIIPILPYQDYVWMSTPSPYFDLNKRYKLFYNIDESVEVYCANYKDWLKIKDMNNKKK